MADPCPPPVTGSDPTEWHHVTTPRQGSGPWLVGLGLIGLIALMALGAHWIWRVVLAVPLGWALLELVLNTPAVLSVTDRAICWRRGASEDRVQLALIEKVVIRRRLDFTTVITLYRTNGEKLRLPPEHRPDPRALMAALAAKGVSTDFRQFSLL